MFDLRTAIARDVFNTLIAAEEATFFTSDELRRLAITAVNAGKVLEAAIAEYDPLLAEQISKDNQTAEVIRQQLARQEPEASAPEESPNE